jgi:hypothetical protein
MIKPKDIPLTAELEKIFWAKVWRYEETGCLLWMGHIAVTGYGVLSYQKKEYLAHRVAYCLHYGVINMAEGLITDHLCCVRPCVEWSHLEQVTQAINVARGKKVEQIREQAKLRIRTHCTQGHEIIGDNLLLTRRGPWQRRRCRLCVNAANRRSRHRLDR